MQEQYSHRPENYICPFCLIAQGNFTDKQVLQVKEDVVYKDAMVTAFMAPKWWKNNPGHVIIIPNEHFENIFDLPTAYAAKIHEAAQKIALAFKKGYGCEGISTRQHNEPDGNQDVWHYHMHVFPRYKNDELYLNHTNVYWTTIEDRKPYLEKIKKYL